VNKTHAIIGLYHLNEISKKYATFLQLLFLIFQMKEGCETLLLND